MPNQIQNEAEIKMKKSLQSLEEELSRIRAGRATPKLLDPVMVSYYGNSTPLNQVAMISTEGALMITVKPYEKQLTPEIEKAIRASDLGLNPSVSGDTIRVPLPPLSEERRKELIKKVKSEGEEAKIAVRNIRRDANHEYKELQKNKEISQDDERKYTDAVQKLTDTYIAKVDKMLVNKEADLLSF